MAEWRSIDNTLRGEESHQLGFGCANVWFGKVSVAWIDDAICWCTPAIESIELSIAAHWSPVQLQRDDVRAAKFANRLVDTTGSIALHLRGTPHQLRVWQQLRDIPFGTTVSYAELAERASLSRKAARAVGSAVGANHVALGIPCHRVLPASGGLGGFRWGVDLKQRLLAAEELSIAGLAATAA